MTLTRRQFLINGSIALTATTTAMVIPSILKPSKAYVVNKYNQWKGFPDKLAYNLDKYDMNFILPSLFSMLLFTNLIDFSQIIALIILFLSISLPFIIL
jgi:hypothetical protein